MLKIKFIAFIVFFVTNVSYTVAQCAMCKASVISNQKEEVQNIGAGINAGVLYLMVIPYLLFAGVYFMYKKHYKQNKSNIEN